MKLKIFILILILTLSFDLSAQEKYKISENFKDLSFNEFVIRVESTFNIKFFFNEKWVTNLLISDYPECQTISCLLDNVFRGTSLHYIIEESGNIVITKNYAIKISNTPVESDTKFLPLLIMVTIAKIRRCQETHQLKSEILLKKIIPVMSFSPAISMIEIQKRLFQG